MSVCVGGWVNVYVCGWVIVVLMFVILHTDILRIMSS